MKYIFAFLIAVFLVFYLTSCSDSIQKTTVNNVFVDVNADGLTDLVLTGEVILNTGNTNFPVQPTNNQP